MSSPSITKSRFIAVSLFLALMASFLLFCVLPLAGQFDDYKRKIAERESLLAQSRLIGARAPVLKSERDKLREDLAARGGFLQGESSELISAALQDRLKRLAARTGATLNSTQALATAEEGGFRKLQLRVNMTAPISAVQSILHDLESSKPLLFVDNLELRAVSLRGARDEQTTAPLQVRFDLHGFVRQSGNET